MSDFHNRLERRAKQLGLPMSHVSRLVGKPDGYFSNMIANQNDPSGSMLVRISEALDATPNDLLGISSRFSLLDNEGDESFVSDHAAALVIAAQARAKEKLCEIGMRPTVKQIIGWSLRNNGRLEDFTRVMEFATLYAKPESGQRIPTSTHVGQQSLATQTLQTSSSEHLNSLLRAMPDKFTAHLVADQSKLEHGRPIITVEKISVDVPDQGVSVDFEYLRAYVLLTDKDGKELILNYSEPIF